MSAPDDTLARLGLRGDGIHDSHPDAALLRMIRMAADLDCQREDAWMNANARPARRRGTKKEALEVGRRMHAECEALEKKIVQTRATTVEGARAKLRMVLRHSNYDSDDDTPRGGTMMCLPLSAMQDVLALLERA